MKNLNEYIAEAFNKRIDLNNSDDNQLKKFSNELSKYINNKYKLDEQLDPNYILNSLKLLKGKRKRLSS